MSSIYYDRKRLKVKLSSYFFYFATESQVGGRGGGFLNGHSRWSYCYRPQGKVMFSEASVSHSVHREFASQHASQVT